MEREKVASLPDRHIFSGILKKEGCLPRLEELINAQPAAPGGGSFSQRFADKFPTAGTDKMTNAWLDGHAPFRDSQKRRFLRRLQRPEVKFISGRRLTFRREAALSPRGRENSEFPVVHKTWVHFLLSCFKYLPFLSHLVSEGFKTNQAIYNWNLTWVFGLILYSNIRLNLRHGCKREQRQQTARIKAYIITMIKVSSLNELSQGKIQ